MYDYLIVGAGLYGVTIARELKERGHSVLILEKRDHIAGNIYTERKNGIDIHKYGAHIFHTSDEKVWNYVKKYAEFNHFKNRVIANYKGAIYRMPLNMYTFYQMFGAAKPEEAKRIIAKEVEEAGIKEVHNLEEQALSLVGRTIYEKLIKGYTEKQRGRDCKDLPAFIIKRLPIRFVFNDNYFDDKFQGVPVKGYTELVKNIIGDIEVKLNTDFLKDKEYWLGQAKNIIYTGAIDEYFDYCFGELDYRSLRFETIDLVEEFFQERAVVNYTDRETPYTRIIEHKYFANDEDLMNFPYTFITYEYPQEYKKGLERYYPINDEKNDNLYKKYAELAQKHKNLFFGGRLGKYKYFDMDDVVSEALKDVDTILKM